MIATQYRQQAWGWAKSRPWTRILLEAALLLLFVLSSTRLLLR
jgi:hypothetical protein